MSRAEYSIHGQNSATSPVHTSSAIPDLPRMATMTDDSKTSPFGAPCACAQSFQCRWVTWLPGKSAAPALCRILVIANAGLPSQSTQQDLSVLPSLIAAWQAFERGREANGHRQSEIWFFSYALQLAAKPTRATPPVALWTPLAPQQAKVSLSPLTQALINLVRFFINLVRQAGCKLHRSFFRQSTSRGRVGNTWRLPR